jgi:hypothetical protein
LDFAKGLDVKENDAFNSYKMAANSYAKPLDIYNQLTEAAGVPQLMKTSSTLQGQINDLEDSIRRAEGNVNATTQNSLVTEGQRAGMIEARRKPLQENLSYLGTGLGRVQNAITQAKSDIGNQVGLYLTGREQDLDVYKTQMNMVADQTARQMTGFTSDRQTQLDILLDKLQRQRQLDDREWEQASELANLEKQYELEKKYATDQLDTEIITVGGRKKLVNKQTGEVVADFGSSSEGGGTATGSAAAPYLPAIGTTPSATNQSTTGSWSAPLWDQVLSGGGGW